MLGIFEGDREKLGIEAFLELSLSDLAPISTKHYLCSLPLNSTSLLEQEHSTLKFLVVRASHVTEYDLYRS